MNTSTFHGYAARLRHFMERARESSVADQPSCDSAFNNLALELFALQYRFNEPARCVWDAQGSKPGRVGHWSEIAPLPTPAFKEFELTAIPAEERSLVFHSSGTTEDRPSRHFHDAESCALYEDSLWQSFKEHVAAAADRRQDELSLDLIALTPPPTEARTSSLVHMFDTVGRRWPYGKLSFCGMTDNDGSWHLRVGQVESLLEQSIQAARPVLIMGTAFNFVHLLDQLALHNRLYRLPSGSVIMETGGYKGRSRALPKSELHALLRRYFGLSDARILCEYGMSELSSQAYDHVLGLDSGGNSTFRCFRFPPWARAQVISPASGREVELGQTGLVRVLDLANLKSILAIQTEDLAIRRTEGFELVGRAPQAEPRGCSIMTNLAELGAK